MTDSRVEVENYEAPQIEGRAPIDMPLIGGPAASAVGISAAFRPL